MTASQQPGYVVAGRYRLERALARGGMGSVWIARHLQLDIDVAVKFMTAEAATSSSARLRFEREAKAAAKLKSAHIVQIMDYGVENDALHIVMELLTGEDLASRLQRLGRLPLSAVASLLGQACKGLALAHDAGIVHRDLKPANLFLAREGRDEIVKVLDFGIAKSPVAMGSVSDTRTGSLIGSPNYMSPEQIVDSKAVDWRSDLWALGVIAFQCLTGHEPFPGVEVGAILVGICSNPIPIPSQVAPDLGPQVDWFFQTALARPPEQRFQTAFDFAQALHALAEGETRASTTSQPPRISVAPGTLTLGPSLVQAASIQPSPVPHPPSAVRVPEPPTALTGSVSQATPDLQPEGIRTSPAAILVGLAALTAVAGGLSLARSIDPRHPLNHDASAALSPASLAATAETLSEDASQPVVAPTLSLPLPEITGPDGGGSDETDSASAKLQRPSAPRTKPDTPPRPASVPRVSTNCDPNYTIDADGHKHFKLECFQKGHP